jgi:hypothetical protein
MASSPDPGRTDRPAAPLAPERVAALGVALAHAVTTRAQTTAADVAELARTLSLDASRVQVELACLSILVTEFCIDVALTDADARRVRGVFEDAVWTSPPGGLTRAAVRARLSEYRDALGHPHPELGRAYGVGRVFARGCGCSHEVAAIEFGARAYMAQLPPMLECLRGVSAT